MLKIRYFSLFVGVYVSLTGCGGAENSIKSQPNALTGPHSTEKTSPSNKVNQENLPQNSINGNLTSTRAQTDAFPKNLIPVVVSRDVEGDTIPVTLPSGQEKDIRSFILIPRRTTRL